MSFDVLKEKCAKLKELKELKTKISESEKRVNAEIELLTLSVHQLLESLNLKKQHFPDIGAFTKEFKKCPTVTEPEVLFGYLRERGDGAIIKEVIHPQTLISYVSRELPEGFDYESIGLSVYNKPTVSVRKA